jgi:hypothetical protein
MGKKKNSTVTVSYSIHQLSNLKLVGKTIEAAKEQLKTALNIDPEVVGVVNGDEVALDYVLQDGDMLEFVKSAGVKG